MSDNTKFPQNELFDSFEPFEEASEQGIPDDRIRTICRDLRHVDLDNDVEILTLGKGSFGTSYCVKRKDEKYYCIKLFNNNILNQNNAKTKIKNELEVGTEIYQMRLQCIPGYIYDISYCDENNLNNSCMISNSFPGYSIGEYFRKRKERGELKNPSERAFAAMSILKPLIADLGTLHNNGYVHHDISNNNILVERDPEKKSSEAKCILIDYGEAIKVDQRENRETINVGATKSFFPPRGEDLKNYELADQRKAWDVYGICAVIFYLITEYERPEPEPNEKADSYRKRLRGYLEGSGLSKTIQEAILDGLMWNLDPQKQIKSIGNEKTKDGLFYRFYKEDDNKLELRYKRRRRIGITAGVIVLALLIFIVILGIFGGFPIRWLIWKDGNLHKSINGITIKRNNDEEQSFFLGNGTAAGLTSLYIKGTLINASDNPNKFSDIVWEDEQRANKAEYTTFEDIPVYFPNLRVLSMYNCTVPNSDANSKEYTSLAENIKLTKVNFIYTNLTNVSALSNVSFITLKYDKTDRDNILIENIQKLESVETLSIENAGLHISDLKNLKNLTSLSVMGCNYGTNELDRLPINLNTLCIDDRNGSELIGYMDNWSGLEELTIQDSDFSGCTKEFIKKLSEIKTLRSIDLSGCILDDIDGFANLIDMGLENLEVLDLTNVKHSDAENKPFSNFLALNILNEKGVNVKHIIAPESDIVKNMSRTVNGKDLTWEEIRSRKYDTVAINGNKISFCSSEIDGNVTKETKLEDLIPFNGINDYLHYYEFNGIDDLFEIFPNVKNLLFTNCTLSQETMSKICENKNIEWLVFNYVDFDAAALQDALSLNRLYILNKKSEIMKKNELEALAGCISLEVLIIQDNTEVESCETLINSISCMTKFRILYIKNTAIDDIEKMVELSITNKDNLNKIDLSGIKYRNGTPIKDFRELDKALPGIVTHDPYVFPNENEIDPTVRNMSRIVDDKELSYEDIKDSGYDTVIIDGSDIKFCSDSKNGNVKSAEFGNYWKRFISDDELVYNEFSGADDLKKLFPGIKKLAIVNVKISSDELEKLLKMATLKEVYLRCVDFDARSLKVADSLEQLWMWYKKDGQLDLEELSALANCKKIIAIDISYGVDIVDSETLVNSLLEMKDLVYLGIRYEKINSIEPFAKLSILENMTKRSSNLADGSDIICFDGLTYNDGSLIEDFSLIEEFCPSVAHD